MPRTFKNAYTEEEWKRYGAVYQRLYWMVAAELPDLSGFRRALDEELAASYPICFSPESGSGETLLHRAVYCTAAIRAGLLQELICRVGADIDVPSVDAGWTPLSYACYWYVTKGNVEYLTAVDLLLSAGARPELNTGYTAINWAAPDRRERRDRLEAYLTSWPTRRARDRAKDAAPAFDYAL